MTKINLVSEVDLTKRALRHAVLHARIHSVVVSALGARCRGGARLVLHYWRERCGTHGSMLALVAWSCRRSVCAVLATLGLFSVLGASVVGGNCLMLALVVKKFTRSVHEMSVFVRRACRRSGWRLRAMTKMIGRSV